MGIKGIYRELGPGQRISLSKLATEKVEDCGRPLRLAIDISIWQFQVQAARGGTNPAIRTLFYRLVRLLGLSIQPIFVFDGPHKPAFKRNKRSGRGDGVATAMAKRIIKLFGFQIHDAPGEAEAECALLQQQGIVDAVLSEDVDTIMFGSTRTLRNWSAEGPRGSKTPTHVTLYDVESIRAGDSGLDREGMVLVALMSGGDYLPEGIPGCGVKVACETARAGFGKSLCRIKKSDERGLVEWKESLKHELRTNEGGFFRIRHKALAIPEGFPNLEVLRYYTHPVVSQESVIERLKSELKWNKPVDVPGLREFAAETFDWNFRIGAIKLIRVLAPGLLVQKLLSRHIASQSPGHDAEAMEKDEQALVKRVSGIRSHFSTDGISELRVAYIPADIVGLDLSHEPEETASFGRQGLALNSDDEFDNALGNEEAEDTGSRTKKVFDPALPESIWLPESVLKLGVPLTVQDWEEKQRSKARSRAEGKGPRSKSGKKLGDKQGALDKWVEIKNSKTTPIVHTATQQNSVSKLQQLPALPKPRPNSLACSQIPTSIPRPARLESAVTRSKQSKPGRNVAIAKPPRQANPWAFTGSQLAPRISKPSHPPDTIIISSSPSCSPAPPSRSPLKSVTPSRINRSPAPRDAAPSIADNADSRTPKSQKAPTTFDRNTDQAPPGTPTRNGRHLMQASMESYITTAQNGRFGSACILLNRGAESSAAERMVGEGSRQPPDQRRPLKRSAGKVKGLEAHSADSGKKTFDKSCNNIEPTTRVLMPRTSDYGFFKEIEVTVAEADAIGAGRGSQGYAEQHRRTAAWRRSRVSIIDLTGPDD